MKKVIVSLVVASSLIGLSTSAMAMKSNCELFNSLQPGEQISTLYNIPAIHQATGQILKVTSVADDVDTFTMTSQYYVPLERGRRKLVQINFKMKASCSPTLGGGLRGTISYGNVTKPLDPSHSKMFNMGNGQFVLSFQGNDSVPAYVIAQKANI